MKRWAAWIGGLAILWSVGCGGAEPAVVAAPDGVEIAYTVHRTGERNLVLVHGWMCDQSYWDVLLPELNGNYGVVTLDLAGHGDSGTGRRDWSAESLAGDVAAVIGKLELKNVIVVGHSMGATVALEVARMLPEPVAGVIAVDSLHDSDPSWNPAQLAPLFAGFESDFPGTCDGFVRDMFVGGTDPELVDGVTADMCGGPAEVGLALMQAYVAYDWPRGFAEAGVPIRSVNADLWPTDLEGNRQVADYDAEVLEGYGHFLMQEAPVELAAAIETFASDIYGTARE